jgi:hypothetical protein
LEKPARDKHCSLLQMFVNYDRKRLNTVGTSLLCPSLPNRRGSAPSGYVPPPPLAKPGW